MNICIRPIENNDFYKGYLDLMYDFSNYSCNIDYYTFTKYINDNKNINIIVIENLDKKQIIGSGTIYIIEKLHNNINKIGYIEDIVIEKNHRKIGLGSKIVNELIKIGFKSLCYKIILKCNSENIIFYEKNGFKKKGVEMEVRNNK